MSWKSTYCSESVQTADFFLTSVVPGSNVHKIKQFQNGKLTLDQNSEFTVKVFIKPTIIKQKVFLPKKILDISKQNIKCTGSPCEIELDISDLNLTVKDLSILRIVCEQYPFHPDSLFLAKASLFIASTDNNRFDVQKATGKRYNTINNSFLIENFNKEDFIPISKYYLIKRKLGLKADSKWRYHFDNKEFVVQARVDLPLNECQIVQIYVRPDCKLERVDFTIDAEGNNHYDTYISYDQMIHYRNLDNDFTVHTFDIRDAIKDKNIDVGK